MAHKMLGLARGPGPPRAGSCACSAAHAAFERRRRARDAVALGEGLEVTFLQGPVSYPKDTARCVKRRGGCVVGRGHGIARKLWAHRRTGAG